MNALDAKTLCDRIDPRSEPVLVWLSEDGQERIELSGPVARRWIAKTDNFMASEFPFGGSRFAVLLPTHWRSPFWIATPWLRGFELVSPSEGADVDLVVANDVDVLEALREEGGPDALVAQTQDSMALAWPTTLPAEILDGTADILSFGDYVESPESANQETHLVSEQIDWLPPKVWSDPDQLKLPLRSLRGLGYVGTIVDMEGRPLGSETDLNGARVHVQTKNLVLFTAQLLQLWMAGASVIWTPGDAVSTEQVEAERPDFKILGD